MYIYLLVNYVGKRPWRPIQSPAKEEGSERLRGEKDQIKFIDLRFERWQAVKIDLYVFIYMHIMNIYVKMKVLARHIYLLF